MQSGPTAELNSDVVWHGRTNDPSVFALLLVLGVCTPGSVDTPTSLPIASWQTR